MHLLQCCLVTTRIIQLSAAYLDQDCDVWNQFALVILKLGINDNSLIKDQ